jgi:glycerophosphoryl diester phosphodiesterase
VRELAPSIRTALLFGRARLQRERISATDAVRLARDAGATDIGVDHRMIDRALVGAARAARLGIAAWTVNDEAAIRRVVDLGVDIVISDRPDLARRVVGR